MADSRCVFSNVLQLTWVVVCLYHGESAVSWLGSIGWRGVAWRGGILKCVVVAS